MWIGEVGEEGEVEGDLKLGLSVGVQEVVGEVAKAVAATTWRSSLQLSWEAVEAEEVVAKMQVKQSHHQNLAEVVVAEVQAKHHLLVLYMMMKHHLLKHQIREFLALK